MIENDSSNVVSAFEMLLGDIEAEIDFVTGVGVRMKGASSNRLRQTVRCPAYR